MFDLNLGIMTSLGGFVDIGELVSSGGIEEGWTGKDIPSSIANASVGFMLGALLTMALIIEVRSY